MSVIDLPATVGMFGGLPKNVKTGKVIARCEDCSSPKGVKLSSLLHQARRHRQSGRTCVYKCFGCGVQRPDAIEKSNVARAKQLGDGFRSGLERAMAARLSSLGIAFIPQYEVGLYIWDFFLSEHGVLIDVDGEYWHADKKRAAKDRAKLTYTERYHPEYRAFRLEEKNFLNPNIVDKMVRSMIGSLPNVEPVDFSLSEVRVVRIGGKGEPTVLYTDFLDAFHYAGRGRAGISVYGAYFGEDLIAVCKFNSVTRLEVASSRGLKCKQVLELDRFCIRPSHQKKNFASWLVSRCVSLAFSHHPDVMELVSFADETFGHSGIIYKASNWTLVGKTRPSYHYMDVSGLTINKKRVYDIASKLKMTEAAYVAKHGLERFTEKPKTKFVFLRPAH
jgi:very-short-patch-repair endonuclease/GNAT superfamily N-acetyltransferase